jgi:hypothetical protein
VGGLPIIALGPEITASLEVIAAVAVVASAVPTAPVGDWLCESFTSAGKDSHRSSRNSSSSISRSRSAMARQLGQRKVGYSFSTRGRIHL